jgi:hypothetical protein
VTSERLGQVERLILVDPGDLRGRLEGPAVVPHSKRSLSRSPTASASRVLPMPPGPVSVTNRAASRSNKPATSSIACSRPTSDVALTGRGRGARPDGVAAAPEAVKRSPRSVARSSLTSPELRRRELYQAYLDQSDIFIGLLWSRPPTRT